MYVFYDTCALLEKLHRAFSADSENFLISNITLKELENIKTSANKDAEIKYKARKLIHQRDISNHRLPYPHCLSTLYASNLLYEKIVFPLCTYWY